MFSRQIIIKDTHRGLYYKDGVLLKILAAGRYEIPPQINLGFFRLPKIEIVLVDMRERDLTIKGQQILTADKVAIRVSIVVQFRVIEPRAALHEVENYQSRLYTDVQLAARRSLASMSLERILTNRNQLSEDILTDVQEVASRYGVAILRADVKDLVFPGNLQEIMNRVLAAERLSQAELIEARTKAQVQQLEIEAQAEAQQREREAEIRAKSRAVEEEIRRKQLQVAAEMQSLAEQSQMAQVYHQYPELLRLRELETLRELAKMANAHIYVNLEGLNSPAELD